MDIKTVAAGWRRSWPDLAVLGGAATALRGVQDHEGVGNELSRPPPPGLIDSGREGGIAACGAAPFEETAMQRAGEDEGKPPSPVPSAAEGVARSFSKTFGAVAAEPCEDPSFVDYRGDGRFLPEVVALDGEKPGA